ncbi:MAG: CDP-alcohol phosphatidyltransferase family protein [Anaerolineae bacterium]|nr:CDP-alcohol phosphatidyltransferase family protein [Anaerolineae bacterium]
MPEQTPSSPSQPVLSDRLRAIFAGVTSRAGETVHGWGVHPDWITIAGLIVVGVGAFFIARGEFLPAAILLLISLPLDALDGAVARAMKRKDRRGAVLDSTLDRYADSLIFIGFAYYFASIGNLGYMIVALVSLTGTFAVSYTRARAGEADLSVKIGIFSRFERIVTLLVILFIPQLIELGMWVLAIGTNFTALQRLWYVYKHLDKDVT